MSIIKERQSVRDGYLKDIPEDIQNKIYAASKVIIEILNSKIDDEHYEDLTKSNWAMSCLDEFKTPPSAKGEVGSVRAYKVGKQYKCMIQVTGHFTNHQYGWIEELLHEIIADTHQDAKPEIRKKFDVTLDNEGTRGNPFEGFDIYLPNKQAKRVWDIFEGRKTKVVKESSNEYLDGGFFDIFKKHNGNPSSPAATPIPRKRQYVPLTVEQRKSIIDKLRKIEADASVALKEIFDKYPVYGLCVSPIDEKDVEREFCISGNNDVIGIEMTNGKPCINTELTVRGYDQHDFMTTVEKEYPDEVDRMKQLGHDVNSRHDWNSIHWCEKICGYDKTLEEICNEIKRIINEKFSFISDFDFIGDNDSGPHYCGTVDSEYICGDIDLSDIRDMNESYYYGISEDLIDYYENYRGHMSYDQYIEEKNHGKLTKEFRVAADDTNYVQQRVHRDSNHTLSRYKKESASNNPEYNVDMTDSQVKRTLRTLSQDIINKTAADKNYKINQYTADIYANIITKNLLPKWSSGYKKLSITLDSYQSFFTLEFKIPTMSQDFVSRFINGREPMNAFLHRVPEIKIKMSPRIFHTMKDPDDAFKFFRAAVRYYDQKVERYSKQLMNEAFKLSSQLKHLISTTNLSGLITCPIQLLFVFDDVHMSNDKTFLLTDEDIKAVNGFMKGIYTKYAAPEKEKKKIVEDVKALVKELRESCDASDNMSALSYLPEAVDQYLTGGFDKEIDRITNRFINEQVDVYEMKNADPDLKYVREKFGVKKLKRIPTDLVAYISIETEAIETPNDKMMIASYCLSKLEIVEWYIELLEVGSEKYVVPHNMPYLVNVRTQLLKCYNKIMRTPTRSTKNRPIISVNYPDGYEG